MPIFYLFFPYLKNIQINLMILFMDHLLIYLLPKYFKRQNLKYFSNNLSEV